MLSLSMHQRGGPSGRRLHIVSCALPYRVRVKYLTVREMISLSGLPMALSAIV
jgi:hypothetical protein